MAPRNELRELARRSERGELVVSDGPHHPERLIGRVARASAVLILFGPADSAPPARPGAARPALRPADLDVVLVQRAASLRSHPGQVGFPGGVMDPEDAGDPVATALREAQEETGLDPAGVEVLGMLPPMGLPVSNYLVHPVLGWWAEPMPVRAMDVAESERVFRAGVADLLDPENRRTVVFDGPGGHRSTAGFQVEGALVWGFTANLLDRVFEELGWTRPWDRERTAQLPR